MYLFYTIEENMYYTDTLSDLNLVRGIWLALLTSGSIAVEGYIRPLPSKYVRGLLYIHPSYKISSKLL